MAPTQNRQTDTVIAAAAACLALATVGLPVLLTIAFSWITTLDFYLASFAVFALIVYAEEGER
jgi:hypothetical protein